MRNRELEKTILYVIDNCVKTAFNIEPSMDTISRNNDDTWTKEIHFENDKDSLVIKVQIFYRDNYISISFTDFLYNEVKVKLRLNEVNDEDTFYKMLYSTFELANKNMKVLKSMIS